MNGSKDCLLSQNVSLQFIPAFLGTIKILNIDIATNMADKLDRTLTVSGAPSSFLRRKTIRTHFSSFGTVESYSINNGLCVVTFGTHSEAADAISKGDVWKGIKLTIDWTKSGEMLDNIDPPNYDDELNWFAEDGFDDSEKPKYILKTVSKSKKPDLLTFEETPKFKEPLDNKARFRNEEFEDKTFLKEKISGKSFHSVVAVSLAAKLNVLKERDRALRSKIGKDSNIKTAVAMKGTCPDMCPEKERLMRDVQRLVSQFEMVEGTSDMDHNLAVKQYSRSSADQEEPLQHELRPEPVLTMTMTYLISKIICKLDDGQDNLLDWYDFCWDRLRAIRKDIIQQQLCDLKTVNIVEQCARFHIACFDRLMGLDVSVFDEKINTETLMNCLQSLMHMYEDLRQQNISCPNEAEFYAYMILLKLNSGDLLWEFQQYPLNLQKSLELKTAVRFHMAYNNNMYATFFKLVKKTSYLNACLLQRFFMHVRVKALHVIIKAFCPPNKGRLIPVLYICNSLNFDTFEETVAFCEAHGLSVTNSGTEFRAHRNNFLPPETQFITKYSSNLIIEKRVSIPQAVVGVQNPLPVYVDHEVHNSFNENHILNSDAIDASDQEEKMLRDTVEREMLIKHRSAYSTIKISIPVEENDSPHKSDSSVSENLMSSPFVLTDDSLVADEENDDEEEEDEVMETNEVEMLETEGFHGNSNLSSDEMSDSSDQSDSNTNSSEVVHPSNFPESKKDSNFDFQPKPFFTLPAKPDNTNFNFCSLPNYSQNPVTSPVLPRTSSVEKSPEFKVLSSPPVEMESIQKSKKQCVRNLMKSKDIRSPHETFVLQKLRKKLHENMKKVSVRKFARLWKQKVDKIRSSRGLNFDSGLPLLSHMPVTDYLKLWGSRRLANSTPIYKRLKEHRYTDLAVKNILHTDVVDQIDNTVKQLGAIVAEMLGKTSIEHAWKFGNITQPLPVFWKVVFSVPKNIYGSTLPTKIKNWCREAFYSDDFSYLGGVEFRKTKSGVPVYTSAHVLEGDINLEKAENMSALVLICVDEWESDFELKDRLKKLLSYKNSPIPLAILSLNDNIKKIDLSELSKETTCLHLCKWQDTKSILVALLKLVKNIYMTEARIESLSMLMEHATEKFIDMLHEDAFLNDQLASVLCEPNNIIYLYNAFLDLVKELIIKSYSSKVYGTACEFQPYIIKLNKGQQFPDYYSDPRFPKVIDECFAHLKLNRLSWPPKNSWHLYDIFKKYCAEMGCNNILSKVIRMINPPDDEDEDKDLSKHLFETQWLRIMEVFIQVKICNKLLYFNIAYSKYELNKLLQSHWWTEIDLVSKSINN